MKEELKGRRWTDVVSSFVGCFYHLSLVRVRLLRVQASAGLDVLEGVVHQASVAAFVAVAAGTVHQLLLT